MKGQVAQGDLVAGVQRNVWTRQFLEPLCLYSDGVDARRQSGDREVAHAGCICRDRNFLGWLDSGNPGVRNRTALLIDYTSVQRAGDTLRVPLNCEHEYEEQYRRE